jgi:polynucleotide 5'-kinase involved in rRNA processing
MNTLADCYPQIRVNDGAYQLTSIPESWLSLKQQLLLSFTSKQSSGAVLVCGKKNVGKSSLARYLVNSLLSKYEIKSHLSIYPYRHYRSNKT